MGTVLAPAPSPAAPSASHEDELVDSLLAGDHTRWPAFVAAVHPLVVEQRAKRRYGDEDAARDVAVRVLDACASTTTPR